MRLHFSSTDYPPPKTTNEDMSTELALKSSGWANLSRDLITAAHNAGNSIICNGSQKSGLGSGGSNSTISISTIFTNKVVRCGTFYRKTRISFMVLTEDAPYRETCLLNDRKNNRQGGLSFPKQIKTVDCRGCT